MDFLSLIPFIIIIVPFTIEILVSIWQWALLSASIGAAVIVLVIKCLWTPTLSLNYNKTLSSLDCNDGEQPLLRVRSRLIRDHSNLPGFLVVTNRRIVFVGKDTKKESVELSSIISVEGRCRFLGIKRWIIIATNDRVMLFAVNYPECLRLFIASIISGPSSE